MKASILGMATWVPTQIRENSDWPAEFVERRANKHRELVDIPHGDHGDLCDEIVARHLATEARDPFLGTTRRHVADQSLSSIEAEARAGEAALADAGIDAADLDLVCTHSMVPDRLMPTSGPAVAHRLGATKALGLGVESACASTLAHLDYAFAMIETGRARYALLTQSHLITRAFPEMHPASPNIGDIATALVIGPGSGGGRLLASHAVSHGEYYSAVTWCRAPANDEPWYKAGDGFYMGSQHPEGARHLVRNAVRIGAQTVREACAKAEVPVSDIEVVVSVQPRRWIPGAIAEVLGLSPEIAPQTFDEYAHLGACGVVTNLVAAKERGMLRPGALVAMYAQGAGFTRAASLVRW